MFCKSTFVLRNFEPSYCTCQVFPLWKHFDFMCEIKISYVKMFQFRMFVRCEFTCEIFVRVWGCMTWAVSHLQLYFYSVRQRGNTARRAKTTSFMMETSSFSNSTLEQDWRRRKARSDGKNSTGLVTEKNDHYKCACELRTAVRMVKTNVEIKF